MLEFYPQIKAVHVFCALLSGSLFAVRGLGILLRQRWPMSLPVKWTSYAIDTTLLTAALMLLTILPHALFANGWLTLKIGLVVVYVVLGTFALKRGRTPRARLVCYVLALLVFVSIVGVARAHHPLGWLLRFFV